MGFFKDRNTPGTPPEHPRYTLRDTPEYAETPPDGPNPPGTPLIAKIKQKIQNKTKVQTLTTKDCKTDSEIFN